MNKTAICGLRAALVIVFLLILLALGALILVGNYFYTFALDPNAKGGFGSAAGIVDSEYTRWLLKDSRDVSLISDDGLELHAYRVDGSVPHRYAVLCHGYQNNATGMASYGKHLFDLGYTVLLPDARGHGESEGDYIGMGWPERRDVVRWCQQLIAEDPEAEIVLYGVSMGAATVMMASGEADLPVQVRCVIEDCGYTSVWDEFSGQLKELFGLPPFPVLNAADLVCRIRAGYSITEASALRQVERSVTPRSSSTERRTPLFLSGCWRSCIRPPPARRRSWPSPAPLTRSPPPWRRSCTGPRWTPFWRGIWPDSAR